MIRQKGMREVGQGTKYPVLEKGGELSAFPSPAGCSVATPLCRRSAVSVRERTPLDTPCSAVKVGTSVPASPWLFGCSFPLFAFTLSLFAFTSSSVFAQSGWETAAPVVRTTPTAQHPATQPYRPAQSPNAPRSAQAASAYGRLPQPEISSRSVILFDARSGAVLFQKNRDLQVPVASTQKLLTALIIAEAGNLDRRVTIAQSDTLVEPTKLYVKPGETYTRRQLLAVLLIKSCNDVACALARDNAGSIANFATRMNSRASRARMDSSHFVNPHGLPNPVQYSTARDMACLARAVYLNPTLRNIVQTRAMTFTFNDGRKTILKNTNRVLHAYSFCNGMKTGYTNAAGKCLISSASLNGREVIAVVLGGGKTSVWQDSVNLLAYGLGIPASQLPAHRIGSLGIGE